jgi:hypothetical protein
MMTVIIFIICFWIFMDQSINRQECVTTPVATEITVAMGM